ncbi:cytochrome o ubiquinol oxidase subunit IV [Azorhizobium oxalatiphilum]|uniref:Cytochrome bo(3) ubiquinol oxidase subunit 4 n=1 Tax=Azorhizobium oxalatiphilum TaxID=980631 RepID=A0A917C3W2_9HYPH|nr:cytochrome o ubiquinol oxidase subunit IV [Azorhizobium oxalatiphilum]GGF70981.1 cytochrome o ubiquinol oxidase subunit IV [Azorhizobium oxalatiphilum]
MSSEAHAHGNAHGHDHAHGDGHSHGSMKSYLIGFFLSVVLTAIPFWLVMTGKLGNPQLTGFIVMGLAAVQIVVHMVYFLHMNPRSEGGWNMLALIFTVVIVVIALSGSLWVMHHLHANMMPTHDMSKMP